jgi:hypothetical protein
MKLANKVREAVVNERKIQIRLALTKAWDSVSEAQVGIKERKLGNKIVDRNLFEVKDLIERTAKILDSALKAGK